MHVCTYHLSLSPPPSRDGIAVIQFRGNEIRERGREENEYRYDTRSSDSFSPSRARFTPSSLLRVAGGGGKGGKGTLSPRWATTACATAPSAVATYSLPLPRPSFVSTLQFFSVSRRRLTRVLVLWNQHPNRALWENPNYAPFSFPQLFAFFLRAVCSRDIERRFT